ncbi:response regulator receiver protein [Spirochaeta thermophila DSM 6578]|uniref:Response regulator receiver protein n=1 Tax=Winmispira thermophila (strain ATCC 700085 / DSM 6578 / Z-1203) TaxID=869211 RepID=G0GDR8_WINT7|nr:response regulator [Spirochaeta thermophila]AEJ62198.1 response regulator receiver protein [Spirochaeta thermophila DSM 6578]
MRRILYAEDEFTNRRIVEVLFTSAGVHCDLVADGIRALEKALTEEYDLIILDQYMPGHRGDVVARKIREKNREVPIVVITSDEAEIPRLREAGVTEVFIKPLHREDYQRILRRYCGPSHEDDY